MKLLFVYRFCTMGGVEVLLRTRLEELLRRGIHTKLLFLKDFGGQELFNTFRQHVLITENWSLIAQFLSEEDFDYILSLDTPQIHPIYRQLNPRALLVYEVHTTYPANLTYLFEIGQECAALIVPSEFQKLLVQSLTDYRMPVHVVPNCVHPMFLTQRAGAFDRIDRKLILWVGRLDEQKNWYEYLQLASSLLAKRSDLEFWIVGGARADRMQKDKLVAVVKELQLMRHFRWLPQVRYEDMAALYSLVGRSGGCLVLTSRNESFGMSVIEAMASRCPVVAPRVGALGELVKDGITGKSYSAGDLSGATEAVEELLDNPLINTRIVERAYQQVVQQFTPPRAIERLLLVLAGLTSVSSQS